MISNLTNLKALNLTNCTQISGKILAEGLSKLKELRSLNLRGCSEIRGGKLIKAVSQLKNLTVLILARCNKIREEYLVDALCKLRNLKVLRLSNCTQIKGGMDLVNAFSNLTNLTTLDLFACDNISEEKLGDALSKLTNLTELNLSCCGQFSEKKIILSKLLNLKKLILPFKDTFLTNEDLSKQISKLTNLRELNLHGCQYPQIAKEKLKVLCPNPNLKITF